MLALGKTMINIPSLILEQIKKIIQQLKSPQQTPPPNKNTKKISYDKRKHTLPNFLSRLKNFF